MNSDTVRLEPFAEKHLQKTFQWMKQKNVRKGFNFYKEISWNEHLQWFQRSRQDISIKNFAIILSSVGVHIGNCGLKNIDSVNLTCEQIIYIGEAAHRGRGYGTDASEQIVTYAFKDLGMKMIYLYLSRGNLAARLLYERIGFTEKAAPKGNIWEGSMVDDVMYMEMGRPGTNQ